MVQVPPPATEPQLSVSEAFAPAAIVKETGEAVLFVTVNTLAALIEPMPTLPNERVAGVTVADTAPVPLRVAVCVPKLSLMLTEPVLAPTAVGTNFTVITQLP